MEAGDGGGEEGDGGPWDGKEGRKAWPEYLVFFEQAEAVMGVVLRGSGYGECWRGWNSWRHDDWRRRGDMVVWCLNRRKGKGEGTKKKRRSFWSWE